VDLAQAIPHFPFNLPSTHGGEGGRHLVRGGTLGIGRNFVKPWTSSALAGQLRPAREIVMDSYFPAGFA